jgi:hypothetical protein
MSVEERWFRFENWSKFRRDWVRTADEVAECIRNQIRPWGICKRYKGSYSFILKGKTRGKLAPELPKHPRLMVGFSSEITQAEDFGAHFGETEVCLLGPRKKKFVMVSANHLNETNEICRVMVDFLKHANEISS